MVGFNGVVLNVNTVLVDFGIGNRGCKILNIVEMALLAVLSFFFFDIGKIQTLSSRVILCNSF